MKKKILPLSLIFILLVYSLSVAFIALPKQAQSVNEKRVLAEAPNFTWDNLKSGKFTSDLDTYLADHFPLRDTFVGINAYANLALGQNGDSGIYKGKDGYLITGPYKYDPTKVDKNVRYLNSFTRNTGLKSSVIIVPTAGYMMDDKLPKNHKQYHDKELLEKISSGVTNINYIDLEENFNIAKDTTQLYYKTDHHLTSQGALEMYKTFCAAKHTPATSFSLDKAVGGFYGTTYSKSGLWLTKSDDIEIWKADKPSKFSVTIVDDKDEKKSDSLYFAEHLKETDKYPVFLDGNHGYTRIVNKDCKNGKRILVVKDSYAHCFTTFLAEDYEEVVMVDLRYFHKSVEEIVEKEQLNEVLYLFGAENFAESSDLFWLIG